MHRKNASLPRPQRRPNFSLPPNSTESSPLRQANSPLEDLAARLDRIGLPVAPNELEKLSEPQQKELMGAVQVCEEIRGENAAKPGDFPALAQGIMLQCIHSPHALDTKRFVPALCILNTVRPLQVQGENEWMGITETLCGRFVQSLSALYPCSPLGIPSNRTLPLNEQLQSQLQYVHALAQVGGEKELMNLPGDKWPPVLRDALDRQLDWYRQYGLLTANQDTEHSPGSQLRCLLAMKVFIPDPSSIAQETSPEKNRLRLQDYLQQAACFQLGMGKLDDIDTLIDHGYLDANTLLLDLVQQGSITRNPLETEASEPTYHQCLTHLLDKGANVNTKDSVGRTALHMSGDPETARLFIGKGAIVSAPDINGLTPLHLVKSRAMAEVLVEAGADIKACDKRGRPPITTAQTLEIAEYFHGAGVPFKFMGLSFGLGGKVTTLLFGVERPEVARWMIQNGVSVNPDRKNWGGGTPLHDAVSGEITDLLLQNGADPFAKDFFDFPPFIWHKPWEAYTRSSTPGPT